MGIAFFFLFENPGHGLLGNLIASWGLFCLVFVFFEHITLAAAVMIPLYPQKSFTVCELDICVCLFLFLFL